MTITNRLATVCAEVPGYSGGAHIAFWTALIERPNWSSLLMLGVYHGRDLALLCELARDYPERQFSFIGVDKFDDFACADWPAEKKKLGWEAAGYGLPPSYEAAQANIELHRPPNVTVVVFQADDAKVLNTKAKPFDVVYLDTSHDYETVRRQLSQMKSVCHSDTLICGDDYSDEGTWGVKRAVTEAFVSHEVSAGWIWSAQFKNMKGKT